MLPFLSSWRKVHALLSSTSLLISTRSGYADAFSYQLTVNRCMHCYNRHEASYANVNVHPYICIYIRIFTLNTRSSPQGKAKV
jgi:hypothetical protein